MVRRGGVRVFIEGGGNNNPALVIEARKAFSKLFERAGLGGHMPRPIPCGSRKRAFDYFVTARKEDGDDSVLLVDSEAPITETSSWAHVRARDGDRWECPPAATDDDLHFMVECMEAWLVADRAALRKVFDRKDGLNEKALPTRAPEDVPKRDLIAALARATAGRDRYDKGSHSFKALEQVDPAALRAACPWADRFFSELERRAVPSIKR